MAFSIRLTEEERKLAESYAKLHSISIGEAFKMALFERIEEEYDLAAPDELLKNVKESIDGFVGEAEQFDDITMLAFRYNGK